MKPDDLPLAQDPLANPIGAALATLQQSHGDHTPLVRKYHASIAPFAALADDSPEALRQLHELMSPGEMCLYISDMLPPPTPGLRPYRSFETVQMLWPENQPSSPRTSPASSP